MLWYTATFYLQHGTHMHQAHTQCHTAQSTEERPFQLLLFYSDKAITPVASSMTAQLPTFPLFYPPFLPGYGAPPCAMDPPLLFPHLLGSPALPVAAPLSTGLLSVSYPTTTEFFAELANTHPERPALMDLSRKFADEDILRIDEVSKLTQERLEDKVRLSVGNASFVLKMVKKEMSRLSAAQ